ATLEERLEQLPVSLALAAALYLAGAEIETAAASAATSGLQIAAHIYDRLRPLAGQDLRLDDDLARLALTLGQPEEAIALLKSRLARSESLSAYHWLVRAHLAAEKSHDAAALVPLLETTWGDRVTVRLIQGEVLLAMGDASQAQIAFEQARDLSRTGTSAVQGLAACAAARGDVEAARELIEQSFSVYTAGEPSTWALRQAIEVA